MPMKSNIERLSVRMSVRLYDLAIRSYLAAIRLAVPFHAKAALWWRGRHRLGQQLEAISRLRESEGRPWIWVHCASLGEFEQGRPLMEAIRAEWPDHRLLLTFFSPSGYRIRHDDPLADQVLYLPPDTPAWARRFVAAVRPRLAVFIKYELWYHQLAALRAAGIPAVLAAAVFRPKQVYFRWYGVLHRHMLGMFRLILVQDAASAQRLAPLHLPATQVSVCGDPRVDRVVARSKEAFPDPVIEAFCGGAPVLVAGSTWPRDEALLRVLLDHPAFRTWKFIVAPHEPTPAHLSGLARRFRPIPCLRYGEAVRSPSPPDARILLIDRIGLLSRLYRHASVAYIGGGFGRSIHNTLEAAVYGRPLLFGPAHDAFPEASALLATGAARSVRNHHDLVNALLHYADPAIRSRAGRQAADYVRRAAGATSAHIRLLRQLGPSLPPDSSPQSG
jgi:3-deoxy-D-manno-octulosonic-acid transferase